MAAPRIPIASLPEQVAPVGTDLLVVQNGPTTKKMTVDRLTTVNGAVIADHINDASAAHAASSVSASPSAAPMLGTDVQTQLGQAATGIGAATAAANGVQTNLTAHINDTSDAHVASAVGLTPNAAPFDQVNVQAWSGQVSSALAAVPTNIFDDDSNGLTPASGGGIDNFLRADGAWVPPPVGTGGGGGAANILVLESGDPIPPGTAPGTVVVVV